MEEYDICQEAFCFVGSGKLHAIYSADGYLEEALLFSPYILESPGVDSAERDLIDPLRRGQLTLPLMIDESSGMSTRSARPSLKAGRESRATSICWRTPPRSCV